MFLNIAHKKSYIIIVRPPTDGAGGAELPTIGEITTVTTQKLKNMDLLFLGNIRGFQLIIIILVILLLFGGKKIPELMRNLGKGVHSFKQGLADAKEEMNKPVNDPSKKDADEPKSDNKQ